jgi:hypothetical protein
MENLDLRGLALMGTDDEVAVRLPLKAATTFARRSISKVECARALERITRE